jgi:hypothetical protein
VTTQITQKHCGLGKYPAHKSLCHQSALGTILLSIWLEMSSWKTLAWLQCKVSRSNWLTKLQTTVWFAYRCTLKRLEYLVVGMHSMSNRCQIIMCYVTFVRRTFSSDRCLQPPLFQKQGKAHRKDFLMCLKLRSVTTCHEACAMSSEAQNVRKHGWFLCSSARLNNVPPLMSRTGGFNGKEPANNKTCWVHYIVGIALFVC